MVWIRNISTVIAGNLATGKKHGYTMLNMKPPVPHVIGRNVDDGFVVRTVLEDDSVIAYRFEGFRRFTKEWPSVHAVPSPKPKAAPAPAPAAPAASTAP